MTQIYNVVSASLHKVVENYARVVTVSIGVGFRSLVVNFTWAAATCTRFCLVRFLNIEKIEHILGNIPSPGQFFLRSSSANNTVATDYGP